MFKRFQKGKFFFTKTAVKRCLKKLKFVDGKTENTVDKLKTL